LGTVWSSLMIACEPHQNGCYAGCAT